MNGIQRLVPTFKGSSTSVIRAELLLNKMGILPNEMKLT